MDYKGLKPLHRATLFLFFGVIALMPVHTFVTTSLADITNTNDDVWKSAKDVAIILVGLASAWLAKQNPKVWKKLFSSDINRLIFFYFGLHLIIATLSDNPLKATAAGLTFNLRFLVMFLSAQVLVQLSDKAIKRMSVVLVLAGAWVVAVFGSLQVLVLPNDVLSDFGYSDQTVKPYLTIDNNEEFVRINSTLRGPNPLGAFSVIVLMLLLALWSYQPQLKRQITVLAPLLLLTMIGSQSRSAFLGLIAGLVVYAMIMGLRSTRWRRAILASFVGVLILTPITYLAIRNTEFYKIQILHNDPTDNKAEDSNSERVSSYQQAWEDIKDNPIGEGPGTSGPASRFNDDQTRLSENYYLQIGQEVGVLGALLFITITVVVAQKLYDRKHQIKLALFSSLVAVSLINLFLHGWADDTTAIIWWGLAGLYINDS